MSVRLNISACDAPAMMPFLRPVQTKDLDDLVTLAQHLDTVNFPNDRDKLEEGIRESMASFSGDLRDPKDGVYQFVLEDAQNHRLLGVSKIIARHGTPLSPHYYWQVSYDHRESKTLHFGIKHQVLKLGKDTSGHTEIAGIIVDPEVQGRNLGKMLFYVRFLYIALHRENFLERVISELLPPLDKDEKSVLWEAYGRKFTNLTYQEADQLSHDNKEFIETLFPQNEIYTCLLPIKARQVIGKVGPKSQPVKHLAEKNGMHYLSQIDPFDGGPHFGCRIDDVVCVKNTVKGKAARTGGSGKTREGLVAAAGAKKMDFCALPAFVEVSPEKNLIILPEAEFKRLGIAEGDLIGFLPYT